MDGRYGWRCFRNRACVMVDEGNYHSYFCLRQLMHAWLALGTCKLTGPSSRGCKLKTMMDLSKSLEYNKKAVISTCESERMRFAP